ncbi:MAG: hypothetical protein ABIN58_02500 [candidate division WOR-3 bacterium]
MAYDFTTCVACRWIQISPRVEGPAGAVFLLDDIEWLDRVGPVPAIASARLYRSSGSHAQVRAIVTNIGDEDLTGEVELELPSGWDVEVPTTGRKVEGLHPGKLALVSWNLTEKGVGEAGMRLKFSCAQRIAESEIEIAPRVAEVFFRAKRSVLWPGETTEVEVVGWNIGNAQEPRIDLSIEVPASLAVCGDLPSRLPNIPARGYRSVSFRVRALNQTASAIIRCGWRIGRPRGDLRGNCSCWMVIGTSPSSDEAAPRVSSGSTEIVFPKNDFGYGIGWIYAWPGRRLAGVVENLGWFVSTDSSSERIPLYSDKIEFIDRVSVLGEVESRSDGRGLRFTVDAPGMEEPFQITFAGKEKSRRGIVTVEVRGPRIAKKSSPAEYEAPAILAGEGAFGVHKSAALFPGLEWLTDEEMSSADMDLEYDNPERLRSRPHPHKVTLPMMSVRKDDLAVSLLWHPRGKGNGSPESGGPSLDWINVDRPIPLFASPDRFRGHASHTLGLVVPMLSEPFGSSGMRHTRPWPVPGHEGRFFLRYGVEARVGVTSVLDCMKSWFDFYGMACPRPLPPTRGRGDIAGESVDVPRDRSGTPWMYAGDLAEGWQRPDSSQWLYQLELNMQAYLHTLRAPGGGGWLNFKGGPLWARKIEPYGTYQFDLLMGAALIGNASLRREILDCLGKVWSLQKVPTPAMEDFALYWGDPLPAFVNEVLAAKAVQETQEAEGGWSFKPGVEMDGGFKLRDYAKLGYENEEAIGLSAARATRLLRAYRLSGEKGFLSAGIKCLEYMEKFRVPKGAQSWEVVVHSPDLLAAAEACEAYTEGYVLTGDERWRRRAVYWASAGIPFIYQWDVEEHPWMRFGTVPAFGSSWGEMPWFGRVVQWNGLRWASAVLDLAPLDQSYPWQMMATGVVISAIYQQEQDPSHENFRLWPDAIDTVTGEKVRWYFSPLRIDRNIYRLLGYELRPQAVSLKMGEGEIRLLSCAALSEAQFAFRTVRVLVRNPPKVASRILVTGVTPPTRVLIEGTILDEISRTTPDSIGWKADRAKGLVLVKPPPMKEFLLELEGVAFRPPCLLQNCEP